MMEDTAAEEPLDFRHDENTDQAALIADAADLERFALEPSTTAITPEIYGVFAEIALTGIIRYPWQLLTPVCHRLLDAALTTSFASDLAADEEAGPPRPMPQGGTIQDAITSLHSLIDEFPAPPFTLQRLCELLLEPGKQYTRADKFVLAVERLLLVTSTTSVTENPPPRPLLSSLGPVNENRPSPYDGQPPAGPQPPSTEERTHPLRNGMLLDTDDYDIFVGSDLHQHTTGGGGGGGGSSVNEMISNEGGDGSAGGGGGGLGSPVEGSAGMIGPAQRRLEPAEVLQAEAFVQAALASPPPVEEEEEEEKNEGKEKEIEVKKEEKEHEKEEEEMEVAVMVAVKEEEGHVKVVKKENGGDASMEEEREEVTVTAAVVGGVEDVPEPMEEEATKEDKEEEGKKPSRPTA